MSTLIPSKIVTDLICFFSLPNLCIFLKLYFFLWTSWDFYIHLGILIIKLSINMRNKQIPWIQKCLETDSLNTQIMTFADIHTYTQLHDIHTYTCQNNFSNCQNNFPTKNFENKKCWTIFVKEKKFEEKIEENFCWKKKFPKKISKKNLKKIKKKFKKKFKKKILNKFKTKNAKK